MAGLRAAPTAREEKEMVERASTRREEREEECILRRNLSDGLA